MLTLKIIIFNGFDELDAIAPFEVLKVAKMMGADLQVELVTIGNSTEIIAAHGLKICPDHQLNLTEKLNILMVLGGGWANQAEQGVRAEMEKGEIPKVISHFHQKGTTIAAICTGVMLLAKAGILKEYAAITHQTAIAALKESGAEIITARVVDDGEIITSDGVTSGLDLSLWLLERYFSPQLAQKVERQLEYER